MSRSLNKKIIPLFIPHIGCPNDCIFCNQKRITGRRSVLDVESLKEEVYQSLGTIDSDREIEIAFFGGSFTAIDKDIQESCLQMANDWMKKDSRIRSIRISTRPDAIDEQILSFLKKYQVDIIELGVQSLDEEILRISNRGHNTECVYRSAQKIKSFGFQLGLQMMVGLPGDDEQKALDTCIKIISMSPNFVRIYPVLVIRDTELESMMYTGKYNPLSLEETIRIVKKIYLLFRINQIKVIRIGLQSSDHIAIGKDVVGGPIHPAFRELVIAELYRDFLDIYITKNVVENSVSVECEKTVVSQWIGNRKSNVRYFRQKHLLNLIVSESKTIASNGVLINGEYICEEEILQTLRESYFEGGVSFVS